DPPCGSDLVGANDQGTVSARTGARRNMPHAHIGPDQSISESTGQAAGVDIFNLVVHGQENGAALGAQQYFRNAVDPVNDLDSIGQQVKLHGQAAEVFQGLNVILLRFIHARRLQRQPTAIDQTLDGAPVKIRGQRRFPAQRRAADDSILHDNGPYNQVAQAEVSLVVPG